MMHKKIEVIVKNRNKNRTIDISLFGANLEGCPISNKKEFVSIDKMSKKEFQKELKNKIIYISGLTYEVKHRVQFIYQIRLVLENKGGKTIGAHWSNMRYYPLNFDACDTSCTIIKIPSFEFLLHKKSDIYITVEPEEKLEFSFKIVKKLKNTID